MHRKWPYKTSESEKYSSENSHSTELLGETESDGILAYISKSTPICYQSLYWFDDKTAIGVDPTFVGSITSTNYVSAGLDDSSATITASATTSASA